MKNREKAMKMFDSQNFLLFASGLGFLVEFKWKSCFGGEKKNWRERKKKPKSATLRQPISIFILFRAGV